MKKKYHIITYGCQANISDSERIESVLVSAGYSPASSKENASLIIINSCSVRQSAVDRVYGQISEIKKKSNPRIIVTGCLLEKDKKNILKIAEFIKITDFSQFFSSKKKYFDITPRYQKKFSALVPIMTGCNNFCTYCAVPYTRGKEKSRPIKDVLKEVEALISKGYKEIWLLGQNVNSYNKAPFSFLLKKVSDIPGNFWIRFSSSHPKDFGDDIIEVIGQSNKITEYVNLPVQSGDDEILKKMNRPYSILDYKECVYQIKKKIPNIFLSTDVIVGFPGETKKQFQNTVKLFKEIDFDMAYLSRYSPRPGTKANELPDNVSPLEKKEREKILNNILQSTSLKKNKKMIGKEIEVLIDKEKKGYLIGKTRNYKTVKIKGGPELIGKFVKIKITKALSWGLEGKINQK